MVNRSEAQHVRLAREGVKMDLNNPTVIIIGALALLAIIGLIGMAMTRQRRTRRLQEQFGPEYERTLKKMGDKREAEIDLEERIAHVNTLNIRPGSTAGICRRAVIIPAEGRSPDS
jgi:hypothetical protein